MYRSQFLGGLELMWGAEKEEGVDEIRPFGEKVCQERLNHYLRPDFLLEPAIHFQRVFSGARQMPGGPFGERERTRIG